MLLDAVHAAVTDLRSALDAERDALNAHDPLALDAATSAKTDLLQRLQLLGTEQERLDELVARSPVPDAWRDIRRQLDACRRINAANGIIVDAQLRHVRRALSLLGGNDGVSPNVYGPRGVVTSHPASRSLSTV